MYQLHSSILCLNIFSYKLCVMIIFYIFLLEITQLTEQSFFACQQNTTQCINTKSLIHKDELEPLFQDAHRLVRKQMCKEINSIWLYILKLKSMGT